MAVTSVGDPGAFLRGLRCDNRTVRPLVISDPSPSAPDAGTLTQILDRASPLQARAFASHAGSGHREADYGAASARVTGRFSIGVIGGGGRNRTGVHGFAGRCMTTLPPRPGGPRERARRKPSLQMKRESDG